ncbi:deoxypyrimidine-specific 5' nucleotidase type C protein (NT5C) [Hydrogenoanaerobacterium saccharovorans]|uniref:5' nucleotidase, deoxy (Pyrimidine), type C protein (NT5C) n=1 Tax=Hydrogenoanaerobacterium saccharovorans TaxID=474960 RepID=A0A1H8AZF9_9FIRM|nr:hypothetical protein [Hydrogenoanaerobacterium saccharovorans]RPF47703.1 deoxypyrimidine-specific 5' nucleotidase type C protein (NT5C) [Hydrogenoanaerobacterium saccharovorans]SEM75188.1 5' nucleotidase, deoxy (Pyrimidine), type C protein (NT5C) [Hydrogenoanaerobacterium saccharovorans]
MLYDPAANLEFHSYDAENSSFTVRYHGGPDDYIEETLTPEELDKRYSFSEDFRAQFFDMNYINPKQRLFVDQDGTLVEFKHVDCLDTLYEPGYFANLKPMENVVQAIKEIIRNHPAIEVFLLSAYLSDSKHALDEKNQSLDKHLPEIDAAHRIFVPYGRDKKEFVPDGIRPNDYLLDDYTQNLIQWEPPAKGIKLLNGINHTKGTWQGSKLSYDMSANSLAQSIVDVMRGSTISQRENIIRDDKPANKTLPLSPEKIPMFSDYLKNVQKQSDITAFEAKANYLSELEEVKSVLTNEQKADKKLLQLLDLAQQSANLAPIPITLPELRNAVTRRLDDLLLDGNINRLLLDKNLMKYGLENAVAIRLQNPSATKLYTQMELSKLGIRVKKGQKPIYIYSASVKAYFEKDGKRVLAKDAATAEQLQIVSGKLPINRQIQYGLNRVFDIEQFDITKSQRQMILDMEQKTEYTYENLIEFTAMTRTTGSLGIKTEEVAMNGLAIDSFYDKESNTIKINRELHDSQKVSKYINSLSDAIITLTSESPAKLQTFESRMLSATLHTSFEKPVSMADGETLTTTFQEVRELFSDVGENKASFTLETLENTLAKVNRAATYVIRGVDKVVESHIEQSQQQEVKQQQKQYQTQTPAQQQGVTTDELVNFIQQIQ